MHKGTTYLLLCYIMAHIFQPPIELAGFAARPPLPPVIYRVGVTGHRPNRLHPNTRSLVEALGSILRQIQADVLASCTARAGERSPRLVLVSSLAEGVDRMAARCALDLGYGLQVPLPFPREEYAADFTGPESLAEFHDLLARADSIFELEASPPHRDFAYRAAGHIVLRQCDLLLAVWDGEPSGGIGGTSELIDVAEEAGRAVLCMEAIAPHALTFGNHTDPLDGVRELIGATLADSVGPSADVKKRYIEEKWPRRIATTSHTVLRLLGEHRWTRASAPKPDAFPELESHLLTRYFRWVDALAVRYGEKSRSAAMRMQLLALGAVVSAILILPFEEHHLWLQFFSFCEVVCIIWLLLEAVRSTRSDWHARWIIYRSLSERLRCLDFLGPLTESIPGPLGGGGINRQGSAREFSASFVQAVTREYGLAPAQVDTNFLGRRAQALASVISSQAAFQHRVAHRYESVEKALQRAGILLFVGAVVLCLLDVFRAITPELSERMNAHGFSGVRVATAAAIVPALGAALAGLAAQGEYKRLAKRAEAMSKTLEHLLVDLRSHAKPSLRTLQTLSAQLAEVLTSEVQEWQVLVASKPPTLPT